VGVYYIWFIFAVSYLPRALQEPHHYPEGQLGQTEPEDPSSPHGYMLGSELGARESA